MNSERQGGYGGYGQAGYPQQSGYPQQGGYPQQSGYPPQPGFHPLSQQGGYPQQPGYPDYNEGNQTTSPGMPSSSYIPNDGGELGEDEGAKGFDFTDKSIRLAFIQKVYAILMFQLTITFGFVALCILHKPTQRYVMNHPALWIIAMIVMFVTLIAMSCCPSVRRTSPMNYIFLTLFTAAEAFMLAITASNYDSMEVLLAVGITIAVCLGLTLFAFQTKFDFTVMGGILLVLAIVLLLFGILTIFFRDNILMIVYASLGALLFSFYFIYDTQLMMGGNHRYSISPEEYIFAALNLYLDILNIFLFILRIIGASKN